MFKIKNYRPTRAVIDLEALAYNFHKVQSTVGHGVKVMVTVKADAYGHGIIPVSKRLCSQGVDFLGVASIDEAVCLRDADIKCPILVLGSILPDQAKYVLDYKLRQTVCNIEVAKSLNKTARKRQVKAPVHIKIDTGMGRIGVLYSHAIDFIRYVAKLDNLKIEGLFTHFPKADTDKDFTHHQLKIFDKLIKDVYQMGFKIPFFHAANSMGIVGYRKSHFNLVRPGLMIYGICPKQELNLGLKQIMTLSTKVVYLKDLPLGFGVGYNHVFVTKRPTALAILPIGYADGYPRSLSNKSHVLINDRRVNIIGRISMDQTAVDVTDLAKVALGDNVILLGKGKKDMISVQELSDLSGLIPYEIVCGIGRRVPRIYT